MDTIPAIAAACHEAFRIFQIHNLQEPDAPWAELHEQGRERALHLVHLELECTGNELTHPTWEANLYHAVSKTFVIEPALELTE